MVLHTPSQQRRALVIVASTRAAAGLYTDTSGPILVEWLRHHSFDTPEPLIVADSDIDSTLKAIFADVNSLPDVVLTTGGTGITSDDYTVDAITPLIDKPLPGISQAFWHRGLRNSDTAILSRCIAGIHQNSTFIMALPGSNGGCKDGIAVLDTVIDHITELLNRKTSPAPHSHQCCSYSAPDPDYVKAQVGKVIDAFITEEAIEPLAAQAREIVRTNAMGAVVSFDGIVRDHDGGERVDNLTYSAHPTSDSVLKDVVAQTSTQHPDARVWAAHRVGQLDVGEAAFIVIAAAAHRQAAFRAASAVADEVKARVPLWKEQKMADGSTQWVGI
ncbi:molybdenum cofactor biosynthesis protein MoaE [Corynebacterium pseudotuberculosis]|uniref:molybdenum cofactor biosynthesis protein MoaE n=1 Tax=Corynebacterium pseudotuberculosis TaxID=1719 RepID=UPI00090B0B4E|nr:Bifunctional molybdopterim biosynthesis protein [Corynebacterium pseudotuberculosis]ASA48256.1 molybdenum cofactor biosynthesis protein MoaB [Corynebacterium pseudotuberculosis Cp162]